MLLSTVDDLTTYHRTQVEPSTKEPSTDRLTNRLGYLFLPSQARHRGTKMLSTLHVSHFLKRIRRPQGVNAAVGANKLLNVHDHNTNLNFLVDSCAQISLVSPTPHERPFEKQTTNLQAANGSLIASFGK